MLCTAHLFHFVSHPLKNSWINDQLQRARVFAYDCSETASLRVSCRFRACFLLVFSFYENCYEKFSDNSVRQTVCSSAATAGLVSISIFKICAPQKKDTSDSQPDCAGRPSSWGRTTRVPSTSPSTASCQKFSGLWLRTRLELERSFTN
jgi:hypothetical protein